MSISIIPMLHFLNLISTDRRHSLIGRWLFIRMENVRIIQLIFICKFLNLFDKKKTRFGYFFFNDQWSSTWSLSINCSKEWIISGYVYNYSTGFIHEDIQSNDIKCNSTTNQSIERNLVCDGKWKLKKFLVYKIHLF